MFIEIRNNFINSRIWILFTKFSINVLSISKVFIRIYCSRIFDRPLRQIGPSIHCTLKIVGFEYI